MNDETWHLKHPTLDKSNKSKKKPPPPSSLATAAAYPPAASSLARHVQQEQQQAFQQVMVGEENRHILLMQTDPEVWLGQQNSIHLETVHDDDDSSTDRMMEE
jgi:hypothetical protein